MKEDTKNIASFVFYTVAGVILNRLSNDIYDVIREKIVKKHEENHKNRVDLGEKSKKNCRKY